MKKLLLCAIALILSAYCRAQEPLAFPFQGGHDLMTKFFKDSLVVSPEIINKKATGLVIFKFTADQKGVIQKIVIYYADDVLLARPIIEALKKSSKKWIVPGNEKLHDFILPFKIGFTAPEAVTDAEQKELFTFYKTRKPIIAVDQIPLDMVTLLPTVIVDYSLE